jgi:DNA-binding GntR family transcriptional regulator
MIDKLSHVPIYLQIERILTEQIEAGYLHSGEPIPSETDLAAKYHVSRMTARKAVDYLVRQGVVERFRGRGTFVCAHKEELKIALPLDRHLTSSEVAESLNSTIQNRLLHLEKVKAPKHVAEELYIAEGDWVWFMKRLRMIGNIPFVFESSHMLADPMFSDLTAKDLNTSKYSYLQRKGKFVQGSQKQIRAELPSEDIRELLGIKRDEPVLCAHSVAVLEHNVRFEISDIYYNQEYYTFTMDAKR